MTKCYHVVFSQLKFPANLAQLVVPKMHCLYANAIVQPSVQHCPCYMTRKTKVHTWCRHCHLCINAPMWSEKRWLQRLFDLPLYNGIISHGAPVGILGVLPWGFAHHTHGNKCKLMRPRSSRDVQWHITGCVRKILQFSILNCGKRKQSTATTFRWSKHNFPVYKKIF